MNKIEKAEQVLADLNAKREALVAKGHELGERRQAISFDAHTGNKAQRAKLDEINSEELTHSYELSSIDAAIVEATKRLAAADAAEAHAADKENARKLRAVVDEFVSHAVKLDDAFAAVVKNAQGLEDTLKEINLLGSAFPSRAQLDSLGVRALLTAIQSTPWRRDFETIAPGQRQTFGKLCSDWASRIESNHIEPKIGALKIDEEVA